MGALLDLLFPYRHDRSFGAASFALVFLLLIGEIEALVLVALGVIGRQTQLFVDLQPIIFPAACLVSLATAGVFWWRARRWTRARIASAGRIPRQP